MLSLTTFIYQFMIRCQTLILKNLFLSDMRTVMNFYRFHPSNYFLTPLSLVGWGGVLVSVSS